MIKKISNRVHDFYLGIVKYPFYRNIFRTNAASKLTIGKHVTIKNSEIYLSKDSELIIDEGCELNKVRLYIDGIAKIGKNNIIGNDEVSIGFRVNGSLVIGDFNRINCSIWSRFNSAVIIGNYNSINKGSELRSDEKISIGDFNQISYNVMIWDTNTHNIYPYEKRRKLTLDKFPSIGYEYEKPKTKQVIIMSDNWIGKNVSILKGTEIANRCIVAYGCILTNMSIDNNNTIITELNVKTIKNKI